MVYQDADGFRLRFDMDVPEDERKYYLKMYPNIESVSQKKIHCTVCNRHLGTAPIQDNNIFMHPVLKVTHCKKCNEFYNSGEFSKGDDGSELYCRWCGQGGQVYCCSKCPYVFCKSCIISNLSKGCISDIEQNENWNCFACAPKITWHLRAQHWALTNFIEKQRQSIKAGKYTEKEINELITKDSSSCCAFSNSNVNVSLNSTSDSSCDGSEQSFSRKRKLQKNIGIKSATSNNTRDQGDQAKSVLQPLAKKIKLGNNNEVVCTPDVLSILEPDVSTESMHKIVNNSPMSTVHQPKHSLLQQRRKVQDQAINYQTTECFQSQQAPSFFSLLRPQQPPTQPATILPVPDFQQQFQHPPPLIIRNVQSQCRPSASNIQVRKTVINTRAPSHSQPVYHTINGYKIDLNSAAQQEVIRLPDGKFIQVKKQSSLAISHINPTNSSETSQYRHSIPNAVTPGVPFILNNQLVRSQQQVQTSLQPLQPQIATITYNPAGTGSNVPTATITITPNRPVMSASVPFNNGDTVQSDHNPAISLLNPPVVTQIQQLPSSSSGGVKSGPIPVLTKQTFEDSPLGGCQTQLQNKIFSGMDICQHLTGKILTLTNSNAYKSVRNITDVKELYIHLSYLFTYAIGRFKSLQDKCLEDMKKLGFSGDASSLEKGKLEKHACEGDEDEVEIVEPNTTCIDLDSDNEDSLISNKGISESFKETDAVDALMETVNFLSNDFLNREQSLASTNDIMDGLNVTANLLAEILDVNLDEGNETVKISPENVSKKPRKKTTSKTNPKQQEILQRERMEEILKRDPKLKSHCAVVLTKIEDLNRSEKTVLDEIVYTEKSEESANKPNEYDGLKADQICSQMEEDGLTKEEMKYQSGNLTKNLNDDDVEGNKNIKNFDLDICKTSASDSSKTFVENDEKESNISRVEEVLNQDEKNSNNNNNTLNNDTGSELSPVKPPTIEGRSADNYCSISDNYETEIDVPDKEDLINVASGEINTKIGETVTNNQKLDETLIMNEEEDGSVSSHVPEKTEIENSRISPHCSELHEQKVEDECKESTENLKEEDKIYAVEIIANKKSLDDEGNDKDKMVKNENSLENMNSDDTNKEKEETIHCKILNTHNTIKNKELEEKENNLDIHNIDNSLEGDVEEILKDITEKSNIEDENLNENRTKNEILKEVSSEKNDVEEQNAEGLKVGLEDTDKKKKDDEDLMLLDGEKMREVLREFERSGGGFDDLDFMGIDEEGLF